MDIKKLIKFYFNEAGLASSKRKSSNKNEEEGDYSLLLRKDLEELVTKNDIKKTSLGLVFGDKKYRPIRKIFFLIYRPSNKLNWQQKKAIRFGLKSKLACVEGPPGTGKSEMITGLLINAVLKGQKVLISSHNNKAVDEVANKIKKMNLPGLFIRSGNKEKKDKNIPKYISTLPDASDNYKYWKLISLIFFFWPRFVLVLVRKKIQKIIFEAEKDLKFIEIKYLNDYNEKHEKPGISISNLLRICHGWGITNLSARSNFPLQANMFDLLIVDEAAQCEIASLIPLMYRSKRIVAVGDPNQLSPIISLSKEERLKLMQDSNLKSKEKELASHAFSFYNLIRYKAKNKEVILKNHYRCHPQIIDFNNKEFYKNRLKVKTKFDVNDKNLGMYWIHTSGVLANNNHYNPNEIQLTINAINLLNQQQGVEFKDIGVITPFKKQEWELNRALSKISNDILCGTIHKFQGGERDTIIINLCIHKDMQAGTKRWIDEYREMLNVAISRAKNRLVVIGDFDEAKGCKAHVRSLAEYYAKIGRKVYNYRD
jgi:superfamily I DNA and/or RNA helicase